MSAHVATEPSLDVARIRADFPILARDIGTHPLVYLDSAATSQKPKAVVDAIDTYYASSNANVGALTSIESAGSAANSPNRTVNDDGRTTRLTSFRATRAP